MKWSVAALVLLGLVAAAAAAMLMRSFSLRRQPAASVATTQPVQETDVLVASRSLPPRMIVELGHLTRRRMPREQAPAGCLSDPAQAVGRVLSTSVKEGQALMPIHFVKDGSNIVSSVVPPGMRAVMVSLAPDAAMTNLLYPGCLVDVLASFDLPTLDGKDMEIASVTVLHGVQVLAIEDKTVLTDEVPTAAKSGQHTQRRLVTVLVTPRQAEVIQLVRTRGQISLTMRNPKEEVETESTATVLSQLTQLFGRQVMPPEPDLPSAVRPVEVEQPETPMWSVVILRGTKVEEQRFAMPAEAEEP